MSAAVALAFVLAAAVAALARAEVAGRLNRDTFPYGTLLVNVAGSLALGLVATGLGEDAAQVLGVAFLGTFTTFSTFARDAADLGIDRRRWDLAALYVVVTVVACVGAAWVGLALEPFAS